MLTNFIRFLFQRPLNLATMTIHMLVNSLRRMYQLQVMVLNFVLLQTCCILQAFGVLRIPLSMARMTLFVWEYLVAKHLIFIHKIRRIIHNTVVVKVVRPLDEDEISLHQGDTSHIRVKRKHYNTRASVSQIVDEDTDDDSNSRQRPQEIEPSLVGETKQNSDETTTNQEEESAQDVVFPAEESTQSRHNSSDREDNGEEISKSQVENETSQDEEVRECPVDLNSTCTPDDMQRENNEERSPRQYQDETNNGVEAPDFSNEPEESRGLNESLLSEYETALTSPLPAALENQLYGEEQMHEERRPTESHL